MSTLRRSTKEALLTSVVSAFMLLEFYINFILFVLLIIFLEISVCIFLILWFDYGPIACFLSVLLIKKTKNNIVRIAHSLITTISG